MRRILVLVFVLLSIQGFAQPSNYSWYKQRTRQYSFMADSAMYLPRYNGTPSGVRSNESSTISGMVGIDTTNHRQYFRSGSSWRRLANYTELGVDSIWRVAGKDSIFWSKQGNNYAIKDSAGGASTIPISSLTAATVDNLIDNTTYRQWWRWTNGLSASTAGLHLQASTNAASTNSQRLLQVSLSGANTNSGQRTHSAIFENIHTGTSSTNVATYSYTSSGTTNIGSESYSNGGTTSYGVVGYALSGTTNIGGQFYAAGGTTNIALDLGFAGSYLGNMRMNGSTSGSITIQPASAAGTYTLTLPTTDGASGEFLQTDGSGVLTWAAAAGGGITVGTTTITSGTSGRVAYNNAGVYGEKAVTGTGDVVLATSPTITTGYYVNDGANKLQVATNFYGADFISKSVRFQSSGNTYLKYTSNDESATDPAVTVQTIVTGKPGLKILLTGSQTADAFYVENSGGNKLVDITANGVLDLYNYGTAPTASVTNGIRLYAEDVSSSAELKVRDEAGNITTLSPHNFSKIPGGKSEEMAWSFYSEKDGQYINVDMLKLARLVEKLTGEKLVYTGKK